LNLTYLRPNLEIESHDVSKNKIKNKKSTIGEYLIESNQSEYLMEVSRQ
jgi:hypothetical protein